MKNSKFNIIDVVIILVIISVLCLGVYVYFTMFKTSDTTTDNTTELHFTVEVNGVTQDVANSFRVGDAVTFGESTSGTGVIKNVEIENYKKVCEDIEKGEFVLQEYPDEYTAKVTISSSVVSTETEYRNGSEIISVGKIMPFSAKGAAAEECYIIDLTEVK